MARELWTATLDSAPPLGFEEDAVVEGEAPLAAVAAAAEDPEAPPEGLGVPVGVLVGLLSLLDPSEELAVPAPEASPAAVEGRLKADSVPVPVGSDEVSTLSTG